MELPPCLQLSDIDTVLSDDAITILLWGHLSKVAVSLGAECRHRLDKTCTHYIYQVRKDGFMDENLDMFHVANFVTRVSRRRQ